MTSPLAEVIGGTIRTLRTDRGWTQRDLSDLLNQAGGTWTRASVGLLETEGVRAERLSDLLLLCSVLDVELGVILRGQASVSVGEIEMDLTTIRDTLGLREATKENESRRELDPDRIGAASPSFTQELAQKTGLDPQELLSRIDEYLGGQDPAHVRDAIAQITPETPRRSAQARRGQATRKLIRLLAAETHDDRLYQVARLTPVAKDGEPPLRLILGVAEERQHGID